MVPRLKVGLFVRQLLYGPRDKNSECRGRGQSQRRVVAVVGAMDSDRPDPLPVPNWRLFVHTWHYMLLRVHTRSAWSPPNSLSYAEAEHRHDRRPLYRIERAINMNTIMNMNTTVVLLHPWGVTCDTRTGHGRRPTDVVRDTPDTVSHIPWRRVEHSLFSALYFLHRRPLRPIYPPDH